jgi:hypothetical protein
MKKPHRTNKAGSGVAWAWMEIEAADLAREKAGKHGFAVYCALCILESKAGQNHKSKFTASVPEIMEITGLGRMSVSDAIQLLRESDLMTVVSGGLPEKSNVFSLHNSSPPDGRVRSAGRTGQVRGADESSPPDGHQIKGRKDSSPSEKESLSSEKGEKGAAAGTPPGRPGGSDSAPNPNSCVGHF